MTSHNWITVVLWLLLAIAWSCKREKKVLLLLGGLTSAIVGDAFLSNVPGTTGFLAGMGVFGCGHLWYQSFAWKCYHSLNPYWAVYCGCGYGTYFIFLVKRQIPFAVWSGALLYTALSVLTLAMAADGRRHGVSGIAIFTGILLLLISDTFISFRIFLHWGFFNDWIIPLYLQALFCITFAGIGRCFWIDAKKEEPHFSEDAKNKQTSA